MCSVQLVLKYPEENRQKWPKLFGSGNIRHRVCQGWIQRPIFRGVLGYRDEILLAQAADLNILKTGFLMAYEKLKKDRRRRKCFENAVFVLILGTFVDNCSTILP